MNYESSVGAFPPAGKAIYLASSPPSVIFSRYRFQRLGSGLVVHRGDQPHHRLELQLRIQRRQRWQLHGSLGDDQQLHLPLRANHIGSNRDSVSGDPNASPYEKTTGSGYGYTDYAPSIYTDINVVNGAPVTGGVGSSPIVPYRNKTIAGQGCC